MNQAVQPGGIAQYLLPLAVFAVIFAVRWRRMSRVRPLRLERLWIVPALYAFIVAVTFAATPPSAIGWLASVAGLLIGAGLGWQRGKTMRLHIDRATHALQQQGSPAAMLFLLALVVVKATARVEGSALHLDVVMLTDALLALALGMFTAMRVEMYLRGKRLLAAAEAG